MACQVRGRRARSSSCNVEPREIYRTSQLLSYLTGVFPQPNKAIVGRNAFAHEAGIHQHGMLQNGLTYEIIRPGDGRASRARPWSSASTPAGTRWSGASSDLGYELERGAARRRLPRVHRARRPQARDPRRGPARAAARELPRRARGVPAHPPARRLRQREPDRGGADDGAMDRRARGARHRRRPDRGRVRRDQRDPRPAARGAEPFSCARSRQGGTAWGRSSSRPRSTASRSAGTARPPTSSRPAPGHWCTR